MGSVGTGAVLQSSLTPGDLHRSAVVQAAGNCDRKEGRADGKRKERQKGKREKEVWHGGKILHNVVIRPYYAPQCSSWWRSPGISHFVLRLY